MPSITQALSCTGAFIAVVVLAPLQPLAAQVPVGVQPIPPCPVVLRCAPAYVLPSNGAEVPVNMVELVWTERDSVQFALTMIEPGKLPVEIFAQVSPLDSGASITRFGGTHIKPDADFQPGTELRFTYDEDCSLDRGIDSVTLAFTLTERAPLPVTLGTLHARERIGKFDVGGIAARGECVREIHTGYADLDLTLSEDAEPYADLFLYQLQVDGHRHGRYDDQVPNGGRVRPAWESARGRAQDRIYAACHDELDLTAAVMEPLASSYQEVYPYLAPGRHEVRMVGRLPDGSEVTTPPIAVDLRCPGDEDELPELDARTGDSGGCAAAASGNGNGVGRWAWLLALVAVVGRARARARARH